MEVKKIWRVQFIIAWALLIVLLVGGGFMIATGLVMPAMLMIVVGFLIEMVSSVLLFKNYRCPKCGGPLNKRWLKGGADLPGMVKCPHCNATFREV